MNTAAILPSYDREQRIEINFPGMQKDLLPHVVRFVRPAPGMCFILYSDLAPENADRVIAEQVAYFAERGRPFQWKVYSHDTPPDLEQRLQRAGFKPDEQDDVMVLDLQSAPAALLEPVSADIRRLTNRQQLADVETVLTEVWDRSFTWVHERLGGHMAIPNYLSIYVAYVDARPAAAAWVYFSPGSQFASLWAGSTVPVFRRRGLYTALLAARVQEARERGYRYLTIDAGPMSRPIVARHGFESLTQARDYAWKPATPGLDTEEHP